MDDRTKIAAMAMQGILSNGSIDTWLPAQYAAAARDYADALIAALRETREGYPLVAEATGLGEVEFMTATPTPQWWGAEPAPDTPAAETRDEVGERIKALEAERDRLRDGIQAFLDGDVQRPVATVFRADGKPSKHDTCPHGVPMYEECEGCADVYFEALLAGGR